METLDNINVLNRLSALQRLCSDHDSNFPRALLFVVGQDGRNNKGSTSVLKYLFRGAIARDLFDDTLDENLQDLEELVILIKHTSVSVIWSHAMKKLLYPCFASFPMLVEYTSTQEEEEDIDLAQARKCCDFKRMLLASLKDGDGLGIPIPIGYDDVNDVESWPLFQSFAIDSVYCPTGFLTAKYNVADITEHLDILFRTVDGFYVDNAIKMVANTIKPHMSQTLAILNHQTGDQRAATSADEVIGPLDILFEFGAMEAAVPVDPTFRPVVLFGEHTTDLGTPTLAAAAAATATDSGSNNNKNSHNNNNSSSSNNSNNAPGVSWSKRVVGLSTHAVIEACEPNTGMRWCRTYFLRRGRSLPLLSDAESLVDDLGTGSSHRHGNNRGESKRGEGKVTDDSDEDNNDDDSNNDGSHHHWPGSSYSRHHRHERFGSNTVLAGPVPAASYEENSVFSSVQRLEALYSKLRLGLRQVVKECFSTHVDALEAGTAVQEEMDKLMKGQRSISTSSSFSSLDRVVLHDSERLLVHMDCLNALGQLVTIEDVDDLGGSCWTYIRVSVYGVTVKSGGGEATGQSSSSSSSSFVSVAVGDTFLFCPLSTQQRNNNNNTPHVLGQLAVPTATVPSHSLSISPLMSDAFCLTHILPYYHSALAAGSEDRNAHLIVEGAKSTHILARLGLGPPLSSTTGSGLLTLPLLTDHPCVPLLEGSSVRVFSTGLLIERMGVSTVPVLLSIPTHVECMWTMDSAECLDQATRKLMPYLGTAAAPSSSSSSTATATASYCTSVLSSRLKCPSGVLIVFRIKDFDSAEYTAASSGGAGGSAASGDSKFEEQDSIIEQPRSQFALNTLSLALPSSSSSSSSSKTGGGEGSARHIAIFVRASSRSAASVTSALSSWRSALRLYSVPEHRGVKATEPLPLSILSSFLCAVDSWSNEERAASFPQHQLFPQHNQQQQDDAKERGVIAVTSSSGLGEANTNDEMMLSAIDEAALLTPAVSVAISEFCKYNPHLPTPCSSGFDAMRCMHTVSDRRRLAHVDHLTPLLPDNAARQQQQQLHNSTVQNEIVAVVGQAGSSNAIIGSLLAVQLSDKLASYAAHGNNRNSTNKNKHTAAAHVVIDFSELSTALLESKCDNVVDAEEHLGAFLEKKGAQIRSAASSAAVTVVSIVLSGATLLCFADVIQWLRSCCSHSCSKLSTIMSVTSPSALSAFNGTAPQTYALAPFTETKHGLGQEIWQASALELLQAPHCDIAVAVEDQSSSRAYSAFRRYVESRNPTALLARQTPLNLRLDADTLEVVSSRLQIFSSASSYADSAAVTHAEKEATLFAYGLLADTGTDVASAAAAAHCCHISSAHCAGIISAKSSIAQRATRCVRISPPSSISSSSSSSSSPAWNAECVTRILQLLFPSSKISSISIGDVWQPTVPSTSSSSSAKGGGLFKRLTELATVKVMNMRQNEEGRELFEKRLKKMISDDENEGTGGQRSRLQSLIKGMYSAHGKLVLPGGMTLQQQFDAPNKGAAGGAATSKNHHTAIVEACGAHCIIRNDTESSSTSSFSGSELVFHGALDDIDEQMLRALFELCLQHKLQRRPIATADHVSHDLKCKIQNMPAYTEGRPLPGNYWFDGQYYVDIHGTHLPHRPDIDLLVDLYLKDENERIAHYNKLVAMIDSE